MILYTEVKPGHAFLELGNWFFHEGQFAGLVTEFIGHGNRPWSTTSSLYQSAAYQRGPRFLGEGAWAAIIQSLSKL
jgi:hypothetical protein